MVKVALVGVGGWGRNHARVLRELAKAGEVDEAVFCDAREDRAKRAAAGDHAWTTDLKEVLMDPTVDAVELATPTPTHHPLAMEALEAGKDVFVEKPLAETPAQARELAERATALDRVVQVGHIFRYHPCITKVRELLADGALGDVRALHTRRAAFREPRPDMGVLHALAVHEVDLYCHLLGVDYPEAILAVTTGFHRPGIEEEAHVHMDFGDGVQGHALESWMSPQEKKERTLTIVGELGAVEVDYLNPQEVVVHDAYIEEIDTDGGRVLQATHEEARTVPLEYREPLKEEVRGFLHAVETGEEPLADVHAGARAVEMVQACIRSAREGRRVDRSGIQNA